MIPEIGEMAGRVWFYLNEHPDVTTTKMIKDLKAPKGRVQQAIGWLAREDKIVIEPVKGDEVLRLK